MRAYELIKETFFRRSYIWIAHLIWLALYILFWWLFYPDGAQMGSFIFTWGGFVLALALSAGIFGDDIASGRICVLVTKPFWSGQLYIYRLLGQSLQAAVHLLLAGILVVSLHTLTNKGSVLGLGRWLLASWLLFNTVAAMSTSLSMVVGRAFNSLLLLIVTVTGFFLIMMLGGMLGAEGGKGVLMGFIHYAWPPFMLLRKFAGGEYDSFALTVGPFSVAKSIACVIHSFFLTVLYSVVGIVLLSRREFSRVRD